ELVLSALVRARFCELLAPKVPQVSSDLFLMGLLSLMDAILEIPMTEVLDNVPLDQGTKAVLSGAASRSEERRVGKEWSWVGIRDPLVTGVQTCALPISNWCSPRWCAHAFASCWHPRFRRSPPTCFSWGCSR